MASYEYDFSAFESSAARKLRIKEEQDRPRLVKLEARPEEDDTDYEQEHEHRKTLIKAFRAVAALTIISSLLMIYLYGSYKCDSIDRQTSKLRTEYNMVCGENTELEMKLSNLASLEQIEKVAVEELGLVKINLADIEFVRLVTENKVIVTQGKLPG